MTDINTFFQEREAGANMGKLLYEEIYIPLIKRIIENSSYVMGNNMEEFIKPLFYDIYQFWNAPGIRVNISDSINEMIKKKFEEAKKELHNWESYKRRSENPRSVPFPIELVEKIDEIKNLLFGVLQEMNLGISIRRKESERAKVKKIIVGE